MTFNEKAATFIGWESGRRLFCPKCAQNALMQSQRENVGLKRESAPNRCPHDETLIGAPDMNKPENYMKALENLKLETVNLYSEFIGEGKDSFAWCCEIGNSNSYWAESAGEAVVVALAYFYDFQHGNKR